MIEFKESRRVAFDGATLAAKKFLFKSLNRREIIRVLGYLCPPCISLVHIGVERSL